MTYYLKHAHIYQSGNLGQGDFFLLDGMLFSDFSGRADKTIENAYLFPGFVDVHVHLREPGFSYKETIATGTAAASHGGYAHLCTMPNLNPVPDSLPHLQEQLALIRRGAVCHVYPYGAITVGEKGQALSDIRAMSPYVIGYSDDGRGVQSAELMREAMRAVARTGKVLSAHCEVDELLKGGYIHDGVYAAAHGHKGISSESEWREVERDIALSAETGCPLHICHVSTAESVALIRAAKKEGVNITCETAPHYLVLTDADLQEDGRFKMNPPLRAERDCAALIEGLLDGTVDMIATDHAPHSAEEKSMGLAGSLMGVTGLECAFPICYTRLVRTGILTLEKMIGLLFEEPRRRFGVGDEIRMGGRTTLTVFDLDREYTIDPDEFLSLGKSTPFAGERVQGECLLTVIDGKVVYEKSNL